jgi:hypothetical protein
MKIELGQITEAQAKKINAAFVAAVKNDTTYVAGFTVNHLWDRERMPNTPFDRSETLKTGTMVLIYTGKYGTPKNKYVVCRVTSAKNDNPVEPVVRITDGASSWRASEAMCLVYPEKVTVSAYPKDDNLTWWDSQKIGTVVHYRNGDLSWVRGVIVATPGSNTMKATALVGEWDEYDLPSYDPDGSVYYPHHSDTVIKGGEFRPHFSNMHEARPRGGPSPAKLKPINLKLPPLTQAQKDYAALEKLRKQVIAFLEPFDLASETKKLSKPKLLKALRKAKAALAVNFK